ncbi:MAG: hypothetical protein M1822_007364 [Bathelium mastoideum]|nr:MAG: hypothetical protein M1822_007364 [Bathelium mastoideum]
MHWDRLQGERLSQTTIVIAIAVPLGILILAVAVTLMWLLRKRWREHKQALAALTEQGLRQAPSRENDMSTVHHPISRPRRIPFLPYVSSHAWGTLHSHEDLGGATLVSQARSRDSSTFHPLPARKERRKNRSPRHKRMPVTPSIPLKKFKVVSRLSAIMESPRSQSAKTPSPALVSKGVESPPESHPAFCRQPKLSTLNTSSIGAALPHPGSPAQDIVPSAAKKPKSVLADVKGATDSEGSRWPGTSGRSISIPAILEPLPENPVPGRPKGSHPLAHSRSRSFCGQLPSQAPSGPVPPLPEVNLMEPGRLRSKSNLERSPSSHSISSMESRGSSLLGNPSAWRPRRMSKDRSWDTGSAQVKEGASRDLSSSIVRPQTKRQSSLMGEHWQPGQGYVFKNATELDLNLHASNHISRASSFSSLCSAKNPLSAAAIKAADKSSLSSLPSATSVTTSGARMVSRNPIMRHSRSRVTLDGSPEEKRNGTLRDISGNSLTLSRPVSCASDRSSRSVKSPLPWDFVATSGKPSALKGSPSARKGHRRGNNVRISSLAPTVLGQGTGSPTPSKTSVPEDDLIKITAAPKQDLLPGLGSFSTRALPEPPALSPFGSSEQLYPKPLRASLTPSSPTLSWTAYHQDVGEGYFGTATRESKHTANESSSKPSISNFQSPRRNNHNASPASPHLPAQPSLAQVLVAQTIAGSSVSAPKTNNDGSESPPNPCYRPTAAEPGAPYDPAWSFRDLSPNAKMTDRSYDPTSPALVCPRPLSPLLLETDQTPYHSDDSHLSQILVNSDSMITHASVSSCSPPVSPKSRPVSWHTSSSDTIGQDRRHLEASIADAQSQYLQPQRPAPRPPTLGGGLQNRLNTVPPLLPAPAGKGPLGPRIQPPSPVRKSIEVLRRMNSDATELDEGGEKRWRRLGREASPILPELGFQNEIFDISSQQPLSEARPWMGDLKMEDIPERTSRRNAGEEQDGHDEDNDDEDEIDMEALEAEIVSGLEEAEALERAELEARQRLGLPLDTDMEIASSFSTNPPHSMAYSRVRPPLAVLAQGRSLTMSSVPEEALESDYEITESTDKADNHVFRDSTKPTRHHHHRSVTTMPSSPPVSAQRSHGTMEDVPDEGSSPCSANVWEDGERFWEMTVHQARQTHAIELDRRERDRECRLESERWEELVRKGLAPGSGIGVTIGGGRETPLRGDRKGDWSIQGTPRSLYDRDGFLRT